MHYSHINSDIVRQPKHCPHLCVCINVCQDCHYDVKSLFSCSQCGSTGCLGLARFLSDCQSCVVFSGTPASLARAPGDFGWCVQNESCLPVSGETQRGRKEGRRDVPHTGKKMLGVDVGGTRLMLGVFQRWSTVALLHLLKIGQVTQTTI